MKYILRDKHGLYLVHDSIKGKHTWYGDPNRLRAGLYNQSSAYRLRRRFPKFKIYEVATGYVLYDMTDGKRKYIISDTINNLDFGSILDAQIFTEAEAKKLAKLFRLLRQEVAL